jgi:RNA recognition motif-containing protein
MGYGFLEFENKNQASEALELLNGKPFPNSTKAFKLNWACYNTNKNNNQNPNEFSIYVCELDASVNNIILRDFFKEKYPSVIDAKIIIDPSTKISKGYGFVKFSDKNESERAIKEMNGKLIQGKAMKTGNASYKKNDKKMNNGNNFLYQNDLSLLQNDPLFNQQNLAQFFMANGYQIPQPMLIPQTQNIGNDFMNLQQQPQSLNPDMNQLLQYLSMVQQQGMGSDGR